MLTQLNGCAVAIALLGLLLGAVPVHADPVDIEDFALTTVPGADLRSTALVPLPDGRYAVAGLASDRANPTWPNVIVAVYLPTLQPDSSVTGTAPGVVAVSTRDLVNHLPGLQFRDVRFEHGAAAYQVRDGVHGIVVGISLQTLDPATARTRIYLLVLRFPFSGPGVGALDPGFGTAGVLRIEQTVTSAVRAISVSSAFQQVYVAVSVPSWTAAILPPFDILRLNADGSLDTTWGSGGTLQTAPPLGSPAFRIEAQADGSALIAGAQFVSPQRNLAFVRLDSAAAPVPSFGTSGATIVGRGSGGQLALTDWAIDPVGRRLLLGTGPSGHAHLSRLNADGTFDPSFDTAFNSNFGSDGGVDGFLSIFEGAPCAVRVLPDGRFFVVGERDGATLYIGRLLADASGLDPLFWLGAGSDLPEFALIAGSEADRGLTSCAGAHLQVNGRIILAATQRQVFVPPGEARALDSFALIRLEGGDLSPPNVAGALSFEQGTYGIAENAASVSLRVARTGGSTGAVSVDYRAVPLTATAGADYTAVTGTLGFADGETDGVIDVPIVNDAEFELGIEEFAVELSSPTNGATLAAPITAIVRILDDDGRFDLEVKVEQFRYALASNGPARYQLIYDLTVTNLGVAPAPERTVSLPNFPEPLLDLESVEIRDPFSTFDMSQQRWSVPTLLLNQSARVRLVTTCTLLTGTGALVTIEARIDANTDDSNAANDVARIRSPCGGDDLAVSVNSTKLIYNAREPVVWNVQVSRVDLGPDPIHARNVELTVALNARGVDPTRLSNISFFLERTTGAACLADQMNRRLRCPLGDFSPGTALPIDLRFEASGLDGNLLGITVDLVSDVFDPNDDNNGAASEVTINTGGSFDPFIRGNDRSRDDCWSGSCCFIATAAYGSWLHPHVVTLREFRDLWLLTHAPGRAFVAWYYRLSPHAAHWIAEREWARLVVRAALAPVVLVVRAPLESSLALLVITLAATLVVRARRTASPGAAGASAVAVLVALILASASPALAQAGATGATPPPPVGSDTEYLSPPRGDYDGQCPPLPRQDMHACARHTRPTHTKSGPYCEGALVTGFHEQRNQLICAGCMQLGAEQPATPAATQRMQMRACLHDRQSLRHCSAAANTAAVQGWRL